MKRLLLVLLLCADPTFAGELHDAQRVLHKYQHRLGMDQWQCSVHVAPLEVVRRKGGMSTALAYSYRDFSSLYCDIWIGSRASYTREINEWTHRSPRADQRDSVVHELVHIVVETYPTEEEVVVAVTSGLKP